MCYNTVNDVIWAITNNVSAKSITLMLNKWHY